MHLPDELWTEVLDYLDPTDIVSAQCVSSRLLEVARDPRLWRYKCFEKAPSAARAHADRPNALSVLTGALDGLSLGSIATESAGPRVQRTIEGIRASRRANAVAEWDCSHPSENVDWYSEYIGRHAPLSVVWPAASQRHSIKPKGMALHGPAKVVTPMSDGALCVWDLSRAANGRPQLAEAGRSQSGLLFEELSTSAAPSKKIASFGSAVDKITIDPQRNRAYVATNTFINEVDLEQLRLVSQHECAWNITALSQATPDQEFALSYGTSWSLHIHDPRVPLGTPSTSPRATDKTTKVDSVEGSEISNIAFLPNYDKLRSMREGGKDVDQEHIQVAETLAFGSMTSNYFGTNPRGHLRPYAHVEPGPQSILHRGANEIIIAGRMPSILFYDRRFFPHIQSDIHSGGRLASMALLPVSPAGATTSSVSPDATSETLIACGEYGGCGSLELYELPSTEASRLINPFSYRNRQEASASKILSVVTQGTRIVFSDADGQIKWVERDGRGLARRWNINAYTVGAHGASLVGEKVVRKMIALPPHSSSQSQVSPSSSSSQDTYTNANFTQGDGDLLVWTGGQIGIVTTKPENNLRGEDGVVEDELIAAFEKKLDLNADTATLMRQEEEYGKQMRRALERQADERRWMSRFARKNRF